MALISYVSKDEAAEKVRPILENMEKKVGAVPNVFRAMAHSPELFEGFLALNGALSKTKLDAKLRELAYIKTSELNGCGTASTITRTSAGRRGSTIVRSTRRPISRPATPTTSFSAT